jgi:hypothetical protein
MNISGNGNEGYTLVLKKSNSVANIWGWEGLFLNFVLKNQIQIS